MADNSGKFYLLWPKEAPVFTPTEEEFKDTLAYINKIRPLAEKFGICKIKPPATWQPPFAVDVDNFKFTPRVQRLNELEAKTRIKLDFLDQIAKFWEVQGSKLEVPTIEKKVVDLYTLHMLVTAEGGMEKVTKKRKWNQLATRMGYSSKKRHGSFLKHEYESILYPYDVFKKIESKLVAGESPWTARNGPPFNKSPVKINKETDTAVKHICHICQRGDIEGKILCDGCNNSYHTVCLQPPLPQISIGDWRCPLCVAEEVSKPKEAFGFEQAEREYTLMQFGEMADRFKLKHFNMHPDAVPSELVEKEFWRILSATDEDVRVEYGADLHAMNVGSGFPTESSINIKPEDAVYVKSGWNLNALPYVTGSLLGNIRGSSAGLTEPYIYVGMCFSTFCWHNEDHWNYSINYLHRGEPKTWYGVPGSRADDFETTMKKEAPELFKLQPDLLHQLVTIMNPNILMQAGVPVYRMDQKAGEFIITFPRAYHAGFNQGFNFAEAINFATADWLVIGRDCITHYSNLHRACVFSHDELVCKMADDYKKLDQGLAVCTYKDMEKMLMIESDSRQNVIKWGLSSTERAIFDMLPDDNRLCKFCKTTCFLSAITCPCAEDQLVCLRHFDKLCGCPSQNHILKFFYSCLLEILDGSQMYRFTLDEIILFIKNLRDYTTRFENSSQICKRNFACSFINNRDDETKMGMDELRELVDEAQKNNYPDSNQIVVTVKQILSEADTVSKIAKSILTPTVRTRKLSNVTAKKRSYSLEELQKSVSQGKRQNRSSIKAPDKRADDDCAAIPCKQPSGKGIHWVQCDDQCNEWFHLVCVGLKNNQAKALDLYVCPTCASKDQPNQKSSPSSVPKSDMVNGYHNVKE